MALIEGLGDEVTIVLGIFSLILVIALAWLSTVTSDIPLLREVGVIVVELRQRRTRGQQQQQNDRNTPVLTEQPADNEISRQSRAGVASPSAPSNSERENADNDIDVSDNSGDLVLERFVLEQRTNHGPIELIPLTANASTSSVSLSQSDTGSIFLSDRNASTRIIENPNLPFTESDLEESESTSIETDSSFNPNTVQERVTTVTVNTGTSSGIEGVGEGEQQQQNNDNSSTDNTVDTVSSSMSSSSNAAATTATYIIPNTTTNTTTTTSNTTAPNSIATTNDTTTKQHSPVSSSNLSVLTTQQRQELQQHESQPIVAASAVETMISSTTVYPVSSSTPTRKSSNSNYPADNESNADTDNATLLRRRRIEYFQNTTTAANPPSSTYSTSSSSSFSLSSTTTTNTNTTTICASATTGPEGDANCHTPSLVTELDNNINMGSHSRAAPTTNNTTTTNNAATTNQTTAVKNNSSVSSSSKQNKNLNDNNADVSSAKSSSSPLNLSPILPSIRSESESSESDSKSKNDINNTNTNRSAIDSSSPSSTKLSSSGSTNIVTDNDNNDDVNNLEDSIRVNQNITSDTSNTTTATTTNIIISSDSSATIPTTTTTTTLSSSSSPNNNITRQNTSTITTAENTAAENNRDTINNTNRVSRESSPTLVRGGIASSASSSPSSSRFQVRLKYMNETQRLVNAQPQDTIGDFRRTHFQTELADNKWVRFIFNGQDLRDDTSTLQSCHVEHGCTVHCLVTARQPPNQSQSERARRQRESALHEDADDGLLGNYMYPLFFLLLSIVWYCRICYRQYFSAMSTVCLIGISFLLVLSYISSFRSAEAANTATATAGAGNTGPQPTRTNVPNHPHSD